MDPRTRSHAARDIGDDGLRVPLGRWIALPGRGTTFVREAGSRDAPLTVLLVHGWAASAGLNWVHVFRPLGRHFRVVAADLRGHARGIRSERRFRLEDCADDLAALVDQLGCRPVIAVGYSMGGLVAQLVWRRHPGLVSGLVLCSTTHNFVPGRRQRYAYAAMLRYGASTVRASRMATRWYRALRSVAPASVRLPRPRSLRMWAAAELRRHDIRQVLEAGHATCQFDSKPWLSEVDVPTAVVVTTKDHAVSVDAQLALARSIESANVHTVDHDHTAFARARFAPVVVAACRDVAARIQRR